MSADELTLEGACGPSEILETVKKFGACRIPDFLSSDETAALACEVDRLLNENVEGVSVHADLGHTFVKRADAGHLDQKTFAQLQACVFHKGLKEITESYYGDETNYPAKLFFVHSTGRAEEPVEELPYLLHYDRHQFLKFAYYLTDVTENDGPTYVVPGEVHHIREQRLAAIASGDLGRGDNVLEPRGEEVALTGPAGTLIVFDTDVPHRAGQLASNHSRKVLRIDTEGAQSAKTSQELYRSTKEQDRSQTILEAAISVYRKAFRKKT